MKTENVFQINKQFVIGGLLMFMPVLFFFAVVMEQFFGNSFLNESIFVRIDKISGILSAFLMVGFPFIAICINLFPIIDLKFKKEDNKLNVTFTIRAKALNILISILGVLTIAVIFTYLFTENFVAR